MKKLNVILVLIALAVTSVAVIATPEGPENIVVGLGQRRSAGGDSSTGTAVQAQAGNVTSLYINSTKITQRWQGYYGNITGAITLDDALNKTLYNWQLVSSQGEVYASNGTDSGVVTWSNIFCFNYTNNVSGGQSRVQRFNGTEAERFIGAAAADMDSINNTFNATFAGSFQVGSTSIGSTSGCRQVTLNVNDAYQTVDFVEVLLTDNNSIIYTALLEQDATGFQGAPVDFEMIVGENGDIASATNYYFFVELS